MELRRNEKITFRCTELEKDALAEQAARCSLSVSEYCRSLSLVDFTKFKEELGKRGFKVREARASTGKLNGYYVTARSGTEYKASEIGKGYTLAHIERTQSKLKCNSMNISHGNKLTPGSGSFQR